MESKVVWYVMRFIWITLNWNVSLQLCVQMSFYDRDSLTGGRKAIKDWHKKYPAGAVLVVIEGHAVINSGVVLLKNSRGNENYQYLPKVRL
jgi:hypothetical protein